MSERTDKRDKLLQQRREARLRGKGADQMDRCKDCLYCELLDGCYPCCNSKRVDGRYMNFTTESGDRVVGMNADKPCPDYEPL